MANASQLYRLLVGGFAALLLTASAPAQVSSATHGWTPTFGQEPGADQFTTIAPGAVRALATVDHGDGPVLYAGGTFDTAGGVASKHLAGWNGRIWSGVGGGAGGWVRALAAYDDGSGPVLIAGGDFSHVGGVAAAHVARWNGESWSALGVGLPRSVRSLAVFDDGRGPALYAAGGGFSLFGQDVPPGFVRRWDGTTWSPVGGHVDGAVNTLSVFDDGSGPALYAGGVFESIRSQPASRVARWDGTHWSPLGSGTDARVRALAVFDDGSGAALFAGGDFTAAGGTPALHVARWDGSSWSPLSAGFLNGTNGPVHVLQPFDDGGGEALHAGGSFTKAGGVPASRIASWDGSAWRSLAEGANAIVVALAAFDDGSGTGPMLHMSGGFTEAGGLTLARVARWHEGAWSALGRGLDSFVMALAEFDDGSGPALYAGGWFKTANGAPLTHIGRWEGDGWSPLGTGIDPEGPGVLTLAVHDDGSGPALYAGGAFDEADGKTARRVARWDGVSWTALGSGIGFHQVAALESWDDGTGPGLYAAGVFDTAGGVPASNIARWDGATWSPLGAGTSKNVNALAVFDDGTGSALYAAGDFQQAGGSPATFIARWDGSGWSAVGGGLDLWVEALAVFDDGDGPALYAGGWFDTAGGVPAPHLARWDGVAWSAPAVPLEAGDHVTGLAAFDDGRRPALIVAGFFQSLFADDTSQGLARWDGTRWSSLGVGTAGVLAMLGVGADVPGGPALFVGGTFGALGRTRDSNLARWAAAPPAPSGWSELGSALAGTRGQPRLSGEGPLAAGSLQRIVLTGAAVSAAAALFATPLGGETSPQEGWLIPTTAAVTMRTTTDATGAAALPFELPARLPPGTELRFQCAIRDAGAPGGIAWSNALLAVTR